MKQNYKNTYQSRREEFLRNESQKTTPNVIPSEPTQTVSNPYLKARIKILTDYPEWRRNEILEMERGMNMDNRHYDEFVKDVHRLGDIFMPI